MAISDTASALPSVDASVTTELIERLRRDLGESVVSTDPARIDRMSVDWAHMSPILAARLPAGRADVVVTPRAVEDVPVVLRHAFELRVPVTARGTGLGNYGQAIPLRGGIVLDMSACRAVVEVGDGWVTAEAGVRMRDLDNAVVPRGQELWMYPSTKGSTLGGFLAGGSGGTGSINYGMNWQGFVLSLDVVPCDGSGRIVHVEGDDTLPFIHAYGTTGVIVRATVRLSPLEEWLGFWAAAPDYETGARIALELRDCSPRPKLVSLDEAYIVGMLPPDSALDPTKVSVRAIVNAEALEQSKAVVVAAGGEVLAARPGRVAADRITSLSFNHSTFHLQKRRPDFFHLEVGGDALVDRVDEVRAVFPETTLHLEVMGAGYFGMLMGRFESDQQVYDGMAALEALGIGIHSPHTWVLERRLDEVHKALADMDPCGLLNPGKLETTE
jgi:FAD/FMN-containing dehydrogenase